MEGTTSQGPVTPSSGSRPGNPELTRGGVITSNESRSTARFSHRLGAAVIVAREAFEDAGGSRCLGASRAVVVTLDAGGVAAVVAVGATLEV